jgi:hypothetical protein
MFCMAYVKSKLAAYRGDQRPAPKVEDAMQFSGKGIGARRLLIRRVI